MITPNSPRNTSDLDPFEKLLVAMDDNGIEAQERRGQQELLRSEVLPAEALDGIEAFTVLGFTFGDLVPGDELFREATLPEGWRREGSDHSMHSYIVDTRGLRRVSVFYKAAFYDRKAFMGIARVGADQASDWIYGDEPELVIRDDLTAGELADMLSTANEYITMATECPEVYGDRRDRAEELANRLKQDPRIGT